MLRLQLRIEELAGGIGREVFDEYGRIVGTLVSISSDTEGNVEYIEVKVVDRGLEKVDGARVKVSEGKVIIIPEWKYNATRVINALDRAYKRRKGVEDIASRSDLPAEVLEELRRRLTDEIKKLRLRAKDSEAEIKKRIGEIDAELLHVARAMALLQVTYFSGEIGERQFENGMKHLRKLRETLEAEKKDAKTVLDKLVKVLELASGAKMPEPKPEKKEVHAEPPKAEPETLAVKVLDV